MTNKLKYKFLIINIIFFSTNFTLAADIEWYDSDFPKTNSVSVDSGLLLHIKNNNEVLISDENFPHTNAVLALDFGYLLADGHVKLQKHNTTGNNILLINASIANFKKGLTAISNNDEYAINLNGYDVKLNTENHLDGYTRIYNPVGSGVYATTFSEASFNDQYLDIKVANGHNALYAEKAKIQINNSVVDISGDITSKDNSEIKINTGLGSTIKGKIFTDASSKVMLTLNNSEWYLNATSELTHLTLNDQSRVYLGNQADLDFTSGPVKLIIQNLAGNGGIFHLRTDALSSNSGPLISDELVIFGTATGNHKLQINDKSSGNINVIGVEKITIAKTPENSTASFKLFNPSGYIDIGAYQYELEMDVDASIIEKRKNWALVRKKKNGSDPELNNTADLSVNLLNINYLINDTENHTLLQRMGELRNSSTHLTDAWVRASGGRLKSFEDNFLQGFKLDYAGIQMGWDRHLVANNNTNLYLGGMVGFMKTDGNFKEGSTKIDSNHVGFYTSYNQPDTHWYFDGFIKYTRMSSHFKTKTGGGHQVKGNGNINSYSLSVEGGRKFYLQPSEPIWYLEPQAQLTYTYQANAKINADNNLRARLDSSHSMKGRVSLLVGYSIEDEENPTDIYFKTGYIREFAGKTGFQFGDAQNDYQRYQFRGNWWENGIGITSQIDPNRHIYFETDYARGKKYNRVYLNLGYRHAF